LSPNNNSAIYNIDGGAINPYQRNYNQPYYTQPAYNPYYSPSYYNQTYYNSKYITKKPEEVGASKLAYNITIDMELYPGTSLSSKQISEMKCNNRYNAVRKAFADFTGRPYIIPPVYRTIEPAKTRRNVEEPIKRGGKTRRKI